MEPLGSTTQGRRSRDKPSWKRLFFRMSAKRARETLVGRARSWREASSCSACFFAALEARPGPTCSRAGASAPRSALVVSKINYYDETNEFWSTKLHWSIRTTGRGTGTRPRHRPPHDGPYTVLGRTRGPAGQLSTTWWFRRLTLGKVGAGGRGQGAGGGGENMETLSGFCCRKEPQGAN